MAETEEFDHVFQDQTREEKSDRFLNSAPKCTSTQVRHTNYTTELDDTKKLLNTQLNKLQNAINKVEQQELLNQFAMEAASSFRKSGKLAPVPSSIPSTDNHHKHHFTPILQDPIGTPVPNHVKEDALSHGSDIHTQLRCEAA